MSDAPERAAFVANLHSRFLFHREPGPPVELELIEVQDLPGRSSGRGPNASYSMTFDGRADSPLEQRTYTVSHPVLGTFPLFIVPIARNGRDIRYEVVFNRI